MAEEIKQAAEEAVQIVPEEQAYPKREVSKGAQAVREAYTTRMLDARAKGEAVWQADPETFKNRDVKAPKIVYLSKKTNTFGLSYPRMENMVPLMQDRKDKGQKSSLYVPKKLVTDYNAETNKVLSARRAADPTFDPNANLKDQDKIFVRPGCSVVKVLVNYDNDKTGEHQVSVRDCYNLDDLGGKAVEKIKADIKAYFEDEQYGKNRRSMARAANSRVSEALGYLARRELNHTFDQGIGKDGQPVKLSFHTLNSDACMKAMQNLAERKEYSKKVAETFFAKKERAPKAPNPLRDAHDARLSAMLEVGKKDPATESLTGPEMFQHAMAEGYAKDKAHYLNYAAKKMMQAQWTTEQIKVAITKYAPGAVYDATGKNAPLADRVMAVEAQKAKANGASL